MTDQLKPLAAVITGARIVGAVLTATLPDGVIATLQFTVTSSAGVRTNIVGAIATSVNSLSYTIQPGDAPHRIGCDAYAHVVTDKRNHAAISWPSTPMPPVVVSSAAPNNADGMPNGTLYFQTA